MLWEQYRHLHASATTNSSSLAAADCARSYPSACSSAQQAAAAWAWFEHGGSSCITPSKEEGLVAAKGCRKLYNSVGGAGPSRFKREVLSSGRIPKQGSADDHHVVITKPGRASRRRHSFDHHHDLADRTSDMYNQRFSSSCGSTSPCFHLDDGTVDDQDVAKNGEGRNTNYSCQNKACSLMDKFEVEVVCKQLHDHLSPSCRSPCSSAEPHEYHESQKPHHDHPQEHLKRHRYIKSCSTATHKPSADNDHHHKINDVVRSLLHLHIKTSSGHSTSAAPPAPFFCSSIATANSIVDHHHHRRSPKHSKAETPINHTAKRQGALHNWGIRENVGKVPKYSGELKLNQVISSIADKVSAAADEHERGNFTLGQHKSQQKLDVPHTARDHELGEEGAPATPSSLHPSDSKFSKALLPLLSHLPRLSALALGHHKHADKSSRDDGVLALVRSNRHRQLHGDHVHHIHHHHHHYYHHPQQINEASTQDARRLLLDYHLEGHAGAHELQAPKIHRLHKGNLVISGAADHGEERPQHHGYGAAPGSRQAAAKLKAEKYLWPAAHRAAAGTDHVALQAPGAPLPTF